MKRVEGQRVIRFKREFAKGEGKLEAILTTFGVRDSYNDIIMPGALDDFMKESEDAPMLWSHNRGEIIGQWSNFRVEGDDFLADGQLIENIQRAEEALVLLEQGAIKGVSIGFDATEYTWREGKVDGKWDFGIDFKKINIVEASLVLWPAMPTAAVTDVKSGEEAAMRRLKSLGLGPDEIRELTGARPPPAVTLEQLADKWEASL